MDCFPSSRPLWQSKHSTYQEIQNQGQIGPKIGFPGLFTSSHFLWYLSALHFPWLECLQRVKTIPCVLRMVGGIWTLIWCRLYTHPPLCPLSSFLCPSLSVSLPSLPFPLHLFKKVNIKFKKPKQRETEKERKRKLSEEGSPASSRQFLFGFDWCCLCLTLLLKTAFNGINYPVSFITESTGKAASTYYGQLCEVSTEKPLKKGMFPIWMCITHVLSQHLLGSVMMLGKRQGGIDRRKAEMPQLNPPCMSFFVRLALLRCTVLQKTNKPGALTLVCMQTWLFPWAISFWCVGLYSCLHVFAVCGAEFFGKFSQVSSVEMKCIAMQLPFISAPHRNPVCSLLFIIQMSVLSFVIFLKRAHILYKKFPFVYGSPHNLGFVQGYVHVLILQRGMQENMSIWYSVEVEAHKLAHTPKMHPKGMHLTKIICSVLVFTYYGNCTNYSK